MLRSWKNSQTSDGDGGSDTDENENCNVLVVIKDGIVRDLLNFKYLSQRPPNNKNYDENDDAGNDKLELRKNRKK